MVNSDNIGRINAIGHAVMEEVRIIAPIQQQLERLRRYIGKDVSIKRNYNF